MYSESPRFNLRGSYANVRVETYEWQLANIMEVWNGSLKWKFEIWEILEMLNDS